jgi:hypothetical protein
MARSMAFIIGNQMVACQDGVLAWHFAVLPLPGQPTKIGSIAGVE